MNSEKIFQGSMDLSDDEPKMDATGLLHQESTVTTNWQTSEPTPYYVVSIEDTKVIPTITIEHEKASMDNDNDDTVDSSEYKVLNVGSENEHESTVIDISGLAQDLLTKPLISKVYKQNEWTISCDEVSDAFDFLKTFNIDEEIDSLNDITLIKFEVKENFETLNTREIQQMSKQFSFLSTIISFISKESGKFNVYWKPKYIQHFLSMRSYDGLSIEDGEQLIKFVEEFFMESLKKGHLGVLNTHSHIIEPNQITIYHLIDQRGYSLLLLAAESGDISLTKIFLKLGVKSDSTNTNAQTLAYEGGHFDILLLLLEGNLTYPSTFDIEKCPENIKRFHEVNENLHQAIKDKTTKVEEILSENQNLRHFYSLSNESALKVALDHKSVDIFKALVKNKVSFGPHENSDDIYEEYNHEERKHLREIQYKYKKAVPDKHIRVLINNSYLSYNTENDKDKFEVINKAYMILNENPFIKIILMVIAASKKFSIIFDFKNNSLIHADPTVDSYSQSVYYVSGRIYIAAKQLLEPATEREILGAIAHEFCHFALYLVYNNDANPYFEDDQQARETFTEISKICYENRKEEEVVSHVYDCFSEDRQHAELTVRIPFFYAFYQLQPEKLKELKKIFNRLFDYFEMTVVPKMKESLPEIENRAKTEMEVKEMKIGQLRKLFFFTLVVATVIIVLMVFIKRC
ncbi:hypothetical protein ACKWTF_016450 [Chironomus riparius]